LNVNPPIDLAFIPQNAVSIAIIVEDPDAPINTWTHWIAWNIPTTHNIRENTKQGISGVNDFSKNSYCGPCPMNGVHKYVFRIYALDCLIDMPIKTKKLMLKREISDHIIAYGEITGTYTRQFNQLVKNELEFQDCC
jgi:Raf kinase inhibitor-like YbhB/YbcL family protein